MRAEARGTPMPDARRMGKTELFVHFSEKFGMKRTEVRDFFDALQALSEAELQRAGEFVLPGMVKFVVQNRRDAADKRADGPPEEYGEAPNGNDDAHRGHLLVLKRMCIHSNTIL